MQNGDLALSKVVLNGSGKAAFSETISLNNKLSITLQDKKIMINISNYLIDDGYVLLPWLCFGYKSTS